MGRYYLSPPKGVLRGKGTSVNLNFLYHVEAVDEFNRVFDANAIINGQHLIFKEIADTAYLQMFQLLATSILSRMGTDAKATWTCTVTEEEV